jgi:hypothetical protein
MHARTSARVHTYKQVVATNANAAYVDLARNLWAAMLSTGEANLLVRSSVLNICALARRNLTILAN